ncbi:MULTISPECIES: hypothetical protein [unclassified Acinetobacter]|uniref:hypothetical protein n=1 Tax=unclassified Acinetobacter TaxID=196816 RepID=UPI00190C01D6|nr:MULTISPECIES: hypothetical protein [unclassified Acinetobacter]MBK0063933.1 hypothetical protein [Acinetobacter sp. S55]MBK0067218.1 hypothetical protein [Acinetobacter sp. S54]
MSTIDINDFCTQLRKGELDEQISDLEEIAQEQLEYNHPLKPQTVAEQHFWGNYNVKAVELFKQLKAHIESGERAVDEFEA